MLIVVVAMFGICWMPLHILNVILNFRPELSSRADDTIAAIYISAHWLAMANSFANPIIYSFTNSIFRVIFLGHVSYYIFCVKWLTSLVVESAYLGSRFFLKFCSFVSFSFVCLFTLYILILYKYYLC